MSDSVRRRAAVVGLGARARTCTDALAGPYAGRVELVAFCDSNAHRTLPDHGTRGEPVRPRP